ncbi:hypothetical protein L207DRAFT_515983 [Hyaloscypha variabilis F]|uniref:Uncharacterized protein n=1 Tax=Hyaloscypha variabilis (strain UAMH 11265 / GT02V1 / F) TaxID=1149755 RepID=A0A2J6RCN0_HYAVF|nr:hypothetical protein L207DRAFT_515983 [Hyaloscypha variabilis F]
MSSPSPIFQPLYPDLSKPFRSPELPQSNPVSPKSPYTPQFQPTKSRRSKFTTSMHA